MSAIAECIFVDERELSRFIDNDGSWEALVDHVDRVMYGYSGYVLATLLPYLEERGITLMDAAVGGAVSTKLNKSCIALIPAHARFLDRLVSSDFDPAALRSYYEDFNETSAPGVERAMLDGIRFLHDAIDRVKHGCVGLLMIG